MKMPEVFLHPREQKVTVIDTTHRVGQQEVNEVNQVDSSIPWIEFIVIWRQKDKRDRTHTCVWHMYRYM